MGFFHDITPDMPDLNSYAEAKAFHDATKLNRSGCRWPSQSKIKHCFTCNGDDSIAFQLYDTECVTYHPDNTITVQGYGTQTTSGFIDRLTPGGIYHLAHSRTHHGPMLRLMSVREHVCPPCSYRSEEYRYTGPDWDSGVVIKCGSPVRLDYNAERGLWLPVDPPAAQGQAFKLPTINRKAAREVSKAYHLADYERALRAYVAMLQIQRQDGESLFMVAAALREGDMTLALEFAPGGTLAVAHYGQLHGGPGQIEPGFLGKLRDWIYDV
jgi:hypothetical protein